MILLILTYIVDHTGGDGGIITFGDVTTEGVEEISIVRRINHFEIL